MNEIALIGKKIGMTREFLKSGQSVPVTVVKMEKGRVIQIIDIDKRGYKAIQIGFGSIKHQNFQSPTKILQIIKKEMSSVWKYLMKLNLLM